MKQDQLLEDLTKKVNECLAVTLSFKNLSTEGLNYSHKGAWNILQCLDHCNRYWEFYREVFNAPLKEGQHFNQAIDFNAGFWGEKFTKMMLPNKGKVIKMKSFKSKNPTSEEAKPESINKFIRQQEELLIILKKAEGLNLNQNKCKLTIPLVKMNYGSTLQFIIFHNMRHLAQAKKLVKD